MTISFINNLTHSIVTMGIPSYRFVNEMHENFICTVCLDVAFDPIMINDCEHIFCRTCVNGGQLSRCPTCVSPFKDPKWKELEGLSKRVYFALKVKCLNPSCTKILNIETCSNHDNECPINFNSCPICGFMYRRGSSGVHSCSQQVRLDQQELLLKEQRVRLERIENQFAEEGRKRSEQQERLMREMSEIQNLIE